MTKHILEHEKQIFDCRNTIEQLKLQNRSSSLWSKIEIEELEKKLEDLKIKVYDNLTPWERIAICRHPERPHALDYIKNLSPDFEEIHGDRLYRDDPALIAGFGKIGDIKFAIIGQEKGHDTSSRVYRNFGMLHPEGYRKALRCMKLAEKFHLPVLSLLDTPGAYPGISAEERGQGSAIAVNLFEMARLKTPIVVVLIGEGCSGGALGMGVGDSVGMLKHAYYSVISPEGCASILWKDASKNAEAAGALKMHAENLLEFGVVDFVIDEPLGGAHHDPKVTYQNVKSFVLSSHERLTKLSIKALLKRRYRKFRSIGEME